MKKYYFQIIVILIFASIVLSSHSKITLKPETQVLSPKAIIETTPTPVPSPVTSTAPNPTPTPNYGYCLYVPVIFYHHIQPQDQAVSNKQTSLSVDNGNFDLQMAYLTTHGYTIITSRELVDAVRNHTAVPAKSVVVTMDDGYADQYSYAFPIIKKYNIKVSLMIPTGLVGNPGFVTWGELNEMKNSGLVYFIDHTWSHYSVTPNIDKIHYEIETARSQLELYTGQKVDLFAYPYGAFSNTEISVLKEDGFFGAFSTLPGFYQCDSFIYTLHRTRIGNTQLSAYGL